MTPERQQYLFHRYFLKTATPAEIHELMDWLSGQADDGDIARLMDEAWNQFHSSRNVFSTDQSSEMLERILQSGKSSSIPVVRSRRSMYTKIAIAASLLLILGAGTYWFLLPVKEKEPVIAKTSTAIKFNNDITPASDKAVLTLANGEQIILDDLANGDLANEQGTKVIKLNGTLSYNPISAVHQGELIYNTITTAKGKQYRLILADGTSVWLNAASELRFPITFPSGERRVELNGEAWFEVAKDSKRPFTVSLRSNTKEDKGEVTALGTQFNVNSYDNEKLVKTTLLEGSVRVSRKDANPIILRPGQQAQAEPGRISMIRDANTDQVTAWKNNLFDFDNENIEDIMRQLTRWYDISVIYEGPLPDKHYFGSIRRQVNLSEVLNMLEIAGGIDFRIDGRKVHIKAR